MKISGTVQRTLIWIHTTIPTLFLTKVPKIYGGEKTASSRNVAGKVIIRLQETEIRSMFNHLVLVSTQNGSRTLITDLKF
jgi:hypothetical protein